ncbi:MAG: SCO family protein [Deltaproteobacteria bacterium]|nr:SCO family protein [Deltaproteobacteria bacterium]
MRSASRRLRVGAAALAGVLLLGTGGAGRAAEETFAGQPGRVATQPGEQRLTASDRPAALREVGFDQKLDHEVPLDVQLRDEAGKPVRLGDYFGSKPVILSLAYYSCPMLCGLHLNGLASSLKPLKLEPGQDFEIVTVSFDPRDTAEQAAVKKKDTLGRYERAGAESGWHFLTGDAEQVAALTEAVGFRYQYDEKRGEYAHPAGVVLLTPEGRVSRYLFGIEYSPRDLRLGLVESAQGKIGTLVDQVLLFCFHYDPAMGRYSAVALNSVRVGGVLTMLGLAVFIGGALRRESRRRTARHGTGAS